jgi:hypothetical protein
MDGRKHCNYGSIRRTLCHRCERLAQGGLRDDINQNAGFTAAEILQYVLD